MAIQGLRTTANFVADQRPLNWREAILVLRPNGSAPLTALTNLMASSSTDDPQFNWWEKAMPAQRYALQATIDAVQTTLPLESGAAGGLKDGHVLLIEQTKEIVLVNGDPTSDTIQVQRAVAGSVIATLVNTGAAGVNPYVRVIGNAQEEGSVPPTGINYDPEKKYNYTQIFRNTLEMTRTASKTRLRTGEQVKEAKRECLELHSIEMEKAFWDGQRLETTRKGKPFRMTGGVLSFIHSNNIVNQAGASTDMMTLEGWLKRIFDYGSNEKMAFTGNTALLAINQIIRKNSTYNIQNGIKEYGMDVTRLVCPFGTLVIKTHPLWNQIGGGTTTGTAYYGLDSRFVVLDMANIRYRYFNGADTKYEPKLESNGVDGMQSGYLTEAGIEVSQPLTHFVINGLATPARDA